MALTIAIQMDPLEGININADSTFMLALEAQRRGHRLFTYHPRLLTWRNGALFARGRRIESLRRQVGDHVGFGAEESLDLATVDVVLLRQDPPFDMAYVANTHLLETIHPKPLVVNDPSEVRNAPEKLFVTRFRQFMPPTLITSDPAEIAAFRAEHGDIILKPLFGNGGAGVFRLRPDDENLGSLLETYQKLSPEPIMVQRYVPDVRKGDKRIILIDGEPVGAVLRVPAQGEARANLHVGGQPVKTDLTAREQEICAALGPELRARGLIFVGIDMLGDYLTEINVTSPTGIQEINRLNGVQLESLYWDAVERRVAAGR